MEVRGHPKTKVLSPEILSSLKSLFLSDDFLREGQLGPVRILIVDDFEQWRGSVRSILAGDSRIEVVGDCSDGESAVQKTEELEPDLVLLDIQLPGINGFIAAQRIAKVSPDTKVLFLSAHGSLEMLREALSLGAGLVVKADAARDLLPTIWAVFRNESIVRFKRLNDSPVGADEM